MTAAETTAESAKDKFKFKYYMFLMEMTHLDRGAPVAEIFPNALPGKILSLERLDQSASSPLLISFLMAMLIELRQYSVELFNFACL